MLIKDTGRPNILVHNRPTCLPSASAQRVPEERNVVQKPMWTSAVVSPTPAFNKGKMLPKHIQIIGLTTLVYLPSQSSQRALITHTSSSRSHASSQHHTLHENAWRLTGFISVRASKHRGLACSKPCQGPTLPCRLTCTAERFGIPHSTMYLHPSVYLQACCR